MVAALVPGMRVRGTGAVVNVTSFMQVMHWPTMGGYTASKAALAGFTETLRLELQSSGVHVLEVIPGPVQTAMQGESMLIPGLVRASNTQPVLVVRFEAKTPERLEAIRTEVMEKLSEYGVAAEAAH